MKPEREIEYSELLAYVGLFATVVWKINPADEVHPLKTIEEIVRKFGKSKALIGLRQAANDTVDESRRWSLQTKFDVNEIFNASGILTVSEITRRYSAKYKSIIQRGLIKNDTEFYVVNAILVDQGSEISDEERANLQRLTETYEEKA